LVLAAALLAGASTAHDARAEHGSRCRGKSTPSCGLGAEPLCLCPSRQASDSECRYVCGVLGEA
jgi:hypothetical protein